MQQTREHPKRARKNVIMRPAYDRFSGGNYEGSGGTGAS